VAENTTDASDAHAAELEQLRVENEALKAQLAQQPQASGGGGWRNVISWILVVLAILTVVAGVFAVWLQTTIADEDRFVDTFAPLPKNEAVATALSERLADELIVEGEMSTVVEQNLPSDLSFLAAPITAGLRTLTADIADGLVRSDVFSGIWQAALRGSHKAASAVMSTGGKVSIDLNEAADEVVSALEDRGVTLLSDTDIELPEIVIFQNDQLEEAAETLEFIDTLGWFVPLLAVLLIIGAIWIATDRRHMTSVVGFGSAIGLLITLVIVRILRAATVGDVDDETERAAAEAVWDTTLRFYRQAMWALIVLGFIVGFVAWVMGPSERAGRVRAWWNGTIARWQGADATTPTSGVAGFVATWKRPIQWGAAVIGLLVLFLLPEASVWSVIIIALMVVAIVAIVQVVAGPEAPQTEAVEAPEDSASAVVSGADDAPAASDT
jgi:hypothetical protein